MCDEYLSTLEAAFFFLKKKDVYMNASPQLYVTYVNKAGCLYSDICWSASISHGSCFFLSFAAVTCHCVCSIHRQLSRDAWLTPTELTVTLVVDEENLYFFTISMICVLQIKTTFILCNVFFITQNLQWYSKISFFRFVKL